MKLSKIKMFFKFNKYSIIETLWSIGSLIMDILMLHHWGWTFAPVWYINVIFAFFVFLTFYGFFRAFISWKTYKVRKEDYIRATDIRSSSVCHNACYSPDAIAVDLWASPQ